MPPPRTQVALAIAISLGLHALAIVVLQGVLQLPDLDLELALPNEAEFGVTQQPEQPDPQPPEPPPPPPAPPSVATSEPGAPKPNPPKPKPTLPPLPAALAAAGAVAQLAPKGTQLALRLDLERVRSTALAEDVGSLLDGLQDVRALLEGSGISPLRDLSRLFLASPDLRREHVVMAGRYVGDESIARAAVQRLADQRGLPVQWNVRHGIAVAAWHNSDTTARVLALLGPESFAITREADLARVLRVARALMQRSKPSAAGSVAESLVAMAPDELLNVSVENARSFVRGARVQQTPERMQLSVSTSDSAGHLALQLDAHFPDPEQAASALSYWNETIERYANHPMLALLGFDSLLRDAKLVQRESELSAKLLVPERQARLILRFASDALRGPRLRPDAVRVGAGPAP